MLTTNTRNKFQEVKSLVNLADVATRLGANLTKQSGSNTYQGTCPTGHSSSSGKSFHIDGNLEVFHCFNCGIGGDVISLVEPVKGLSKWESLKWLVSEFNLKVDLGQQLHSPKPTPEEIKEAKELRERSIIFEKIFEHGKKLLYEKEGNEALKYLTDVRGYDVEILKSTEWFYLGEGLDAIEHIYKSNPELKQACSNIEINGYYGDNFRLAFPYRNKDGMITGFLKRATKPKGITVTTYDEKTHNDVRWDSTPKLKKNDLFGLNKVNNSEDTLVVVEGYPDAIYLQALGIKNIVAVGQGLLSEKHLAGMISRKIKNVIISFDNDGVGSDNSKKAIELLLKNTSIVTYIIDPKEYGSHKDPDEYFKANGIDALKKIFAEKPQHGVSWIVSELVRETKTANPLRISKVKNVILELLAQANDKTISENVRKDYPTIFPETKSDFQKLVKSKIVVDSNTKIKQSVSQSIVPFIDTNTNSRCYYNSLDDTLSLGVDEKIIEEIMLDYNLEKPNRYPTFKVQFNPHDMGNRFNIKDKLFNLFTPTPYMLQNKNDDVIDLEVSCPRTFRLIKNLIPVEDEREHFINWLSYVFSTRNKARTSWVFKGTQGSGKNLFFDHIIKPLFGERQTMVVDDDRLQSDFNGYMMNKLFVAFNEVANNDSSSKRSVKSKIKSLISDKKVIINEKHLKTYEIENHTNIMFFSNEAIPLLIEVGDRRFNVVETGGKLKEVSSFAVNPIEFIKALENELVDFAQYLLNYKYNEILVDEVIENEAKASIQELSMNRFELFANKLKSNDWDWFDENYPKVGFNGTYDRREGLMNKKELESKEVLKEVLVRTFSLINSGFYVTSTKLTQQLKLSGIVTKRKRIGSSNSSFYYKWE